MNKTFAVAEVKAVDDSTLPNGEFEVILSAPTLDRDGEIVDAKCFEPLPDHITFDIDHGLSVATVVGSGVPRYDGDLLKVRGAWSSRPLAQEVRGLVQEGHIRTTSVAFMEAKREMKDGVPHIVKAELLNGAFVAVPSNREAVVLAAKGLADDKPRTTGKAIAGSIEERRDLVRDSLREVHSEAWGVWVLATFDDSVVYEVETMEGSEQFRATYEIDEGVVSLGAGEPVEVTEIVTPKGADSAKSTDTDPETAAASAAASSPADVAVVARARAAVARARLVLTN